MKYLYLTLICFFFLITSAFGQSLLNDDVVSMLGMGLNENIVISKIKNSDNNFNTSPLALKELQDQKVSPAVISALIEAAGLEDHGNDKPERGEYFDAALGSETIELSPVRIRVEHSNRKRWIPIYGQFAGTEMFVFLNGDSADQDVMNGEISFKTTIDPMRIHLLHFDKNKKKERFVVFSKGKSSRELQIKSSRDGDGIYQITVKETLEPGEYAFIVEGQNTSGSKNALIQQAMSRSFLGAVAYDFKVL